MDDDKRLQLIVEAVKYCQHVKKIGMPSRCYAKALREPVHFLWERRIGASTKRICGPKVCAAKLRSKAATGVSFGKGQLVYDHVPPFKCLQGELLNLADVTVDSVRRVLNDLCMPVLITKREDRLLDRYRSRKPGNCKRAVILARYRRAGIKLMKNECTSSQRAVVKHK